MKQLKAYRRLNQSKAWKLSAERFLGVSVKFVQFLQLYVIFATDGSHTVFEWNELGLKLSTPIFIPLATSTM